MLPSPLQEQMSMETYTGIVWDFPVFHKWFIYRRTQKQSPMTPMISLEITHPVLQFETDLNKHVFYPLCVIKPGNLFHWKKKWLSTAFTSSQLNLSSIVSHWVVLIWRFSHGGEPSRLWFGAGVVTSGVYTQQCSAFDVFISSKQDVPTYLQYGGTQLPCVCHICA